MFKRRRASSIPAAPNPPSASASLAATKAFLQNSKSNAALSSAAAAAALRTHPQAPTAVGNTVTKRMVRRSSISSNGSGSIQGPPALRRHSSSGSMTERSFRSPSPNRSPVAPDDAPPVPAVPKIVPTGPAVHRRASSLEPRRGGSPARRGSGRGVSVDTGNRAAVPPGQRVVSLPQLPEYDQDERRSINFSRPISPPIAASASPKTARAQQSGWFAAPVVNADQTFRGGPTVRQKTADSSVQHEAQNTWQAIQNAADRPVSTRKAQMGQGVVGARLNSGSMRGKHAPSAITHRQQTASGPVDPKSPDAVYDPSTRTFIRKQDAMAKHRQRHDEEEYAQPPAVQYVQSPKPRTLHSQPDTPHSPLRYEHLPERSPSPPHEQYAHQAPARFPPIQDRAPSPSRERVLASPISFHVNAEIPPSPAQYSAGRESPVSNRDVREWHPSPLQQHEEAAESESAHVLSDRIEPQVRGEERHTQSDASVPSTGAVQSRRLSEEIAGADVKPLDFDPTSEPSKMQPDVAAFPKQRASRATPSPRTGSPASRVSDALTGRERGSIRSDRNSSLSPQRNARFASGSLELPNDLRHEPPPRSVSPAKSALKHSPSGSRRNSSPFVNNGRALEASVTSDAGSEEGTGRKRRQHRVSFEEAPEIAGTSAYGEMELPSSSTGMARSSRSALDREESLDDLMKPRAALPSFGSIRRQNRRAADGDMPEKVTETVSSSLSASVGSIGQPVEASSDQALGGVVVQDFATKKQNVSNEPLPPEVTSVEGSGYYSDSISTDTAQTDDEQHDNLPVKDQSAPEPKTLMSPVENATPVETKPAADVPIIALQPATPNLGQTEEPTFYEPSSPVHRGSTESGPKSPRSPIPGGWEEDESEPETQTQSQTVAIEDASAPQGLTFVEPTGPRRSTQETESSSDDDSIYSDAYEDFTDTEDGGFASIDQIVESPISKAPSGLFQSRFAEPSASTPPKSNLQNEYTPVAKGNPERSSSDDWDAAREQRGDVVHSHKQQQQEKQSTKPTLPVSTTVTARQQKIQESPKEERAPAKSRVKASPNTPKSNATGPITPVAAQPRKSALKKTTPGSQSTPPSESHMRKTMRGSPAPQASSARDTSMRRTMRSSSASGTASTGLAASRFNTPPAQASPPKGTLQKKQIPPSTITPRSRMQTASEPVTSKPLAKALTYDSDSDASASSFQRERQRRRSSRGGDDRIVMRRSMRSETAPTMRPTPTVRSISPPTKASPPPQSAFRKSLRATSPAIEASAPKSSRFSIRSLSPVGRLAKPSKAKQQPAAKPAVSSRFADSSDEEDVPRPRHFQSRFADSDDDEDYELPQGLTPVRGIPRRPGEEDGDSTDLEDENSDNERVATPKAAKKGEAALTNGNTNGLLKSKHAPELPVMEAGKKAKAKRGFFGLGKKKTAVAEEPPAEPKTEVASPPSPDIPAPPPHKERGERANRPLTPIGEDKDLETSPPPRTRSPKLQRRVTPQWSRTNSDSWPLPSPAAGDEERPQTSDGTLHARFSLRPTVIKRHSSSTSQPTVATANTAVGPKTGKEVIVGRAGKKKKFQGLRRVFGLHD